MLALAKMLLNGNALVVDTLSTVVSLPGCPVGHWHADLDDPRDAAWFLSDGARHAPPPGLIAIVPLVNVSSRRGETPHADNGPTEFLLGSHVTRMLDEPNWWATRADTRPHLTRHCIISSAPNSLSLWCVCTLCVRYRWATMQQDKDPMVAKLELALDATAGDAVLFDVRIRHRGGPNRSPEPRPIMYVGYMQRWFRDTVNFKEAHTAAWDALPGKTLRALLARKDAEAYVHLLEAALADRGVDVNALRALGDVAASKQVV